jgi:serine/threonine-protein kinase
MPDMTGKTLGKYRLVERLGRGGMAEVYRAFQPSLEREVAIKVMHGYLAEDESFIGRFKREAKAVAALHHSHIVQVYDFDVEDDMYYMVMEHIEGETLKERLRRLYAQGRQMPLEEVARIFRSLCDALDYAHGQGRIHRDLKPGNVMFDGDRLVLTDFGLATIVGGTRYTLEGSVIGTPAYMSPEQAQGKAGDVRSDIYALGVMLYESVTGQVPFDADTPLAIIMKHVNEPLPMPSRVVVDLPPAVERVILKALAKAPDDRYQSAGALANALETAVKEDIRRTQEAAPSVVEKTSVPGEVLPSDAVPVEVMLPAEDTPPPSAATIPPEITPSAEEAAPPVDVAVLAETTPSEVPSPSMPPRASPSDAAVPMPAAKPKRKVWRWVLIGAAILLVAALAVTAAIVVPGWLTGDTDEPVVEQPTKRPAPLPKDSQAAEHFDKGLKAFEEWEPEKAIAEFTRVIDLAPDFAPAYHMRGVVYRELDHYESAKADLDEAIRLKRDFAQAYFDRALLYLYGFDRVEEAMTDLSMAIDLDPGHVEAHISRAEIFLWYLGEPQRALPDLDRAIELDPKRPEPWSMRAEAHLALQNLERTIADAEQSLELDWENPHAHWLAADAYYWMEDYGNAVYHYDETIRLEPTNLSIYQSRGMAHLKNYDLDEALEDFERVLRVEPDHVAAHYGRGKVLAEVGDYEAAINEFTTVLRYERHTYEWPFFIEDHPLIDRAGAYYEMDRLDEAMADLSMLIEQEPYLYLPYYYRGQLFEEVEEYEAARADYQKLWENAPDDEWRELAEDLLDGLQE